MFREVDHDGRTQRGICLVRPKISNIFDFILTASPGVFPAYCAPKFFSPHTRECDISTYVHGVSVHIVPVAGCNLTCTGCNLTCTGCNLIITGKLLVTLKIVHNPYTHQGFLHKVVGVFYMASPFGKYILSIVKSVM